jgi:hypothetical protein
MELPGRELPERELPGAWSWPDAWARPGVPLSGAGASDAAGPADDASRSLVGVKGGPLAMV